MAISKNYKSKELDAFAEYEESGIDLPERGERKFGAGELITPETIFGQYFGGEVPKWVEEVFDIEDDGAKEVQKTCLSFVWNGEYVYDSRPVGKQFEEGGVVRFRRKANPMPLQRAIDSGAITPASIAEKARKLGFTEFSLAYAPSELVDGILADETARECVALETAADREDISPDAAFDCAAAKQWVETSNLAALVLSGATMNHRRLEQLERAEASMCYRYGRMSVTEYIAVMEAAEVAPDISPERLAEAAECLRQRVWLMDGEDASSLAPRFKRWGAFKPGDTRFRFSTSTESRGEIDYPHGRQGDFAIFELFEDREEAIRKAFEGFWTSSYAPITCGNLLRLRNWQGYSEVIRILGVNPYPYSGGRNTPLVIPARGLTRERVKEAVRRDGRCFRIRVDCDARGGDKSNPIPIDNLSKWLFGVPGRDGRGHIWIGEDGIHLPEGTPQECIDLLKRVVVKMK